MSLIQAINKLREFSQEVPLPPRLPSTEEVECMEKELGVKFHPDYKTYLLEASDSVLGTLEPAVITLPGSHIYLPDIVRSARKMGVPEELFPICSNNGDYFCLNELGEVVYWSHNGAVNEKWPNLAAWITDEWIAKNA